MTTPRTLLPHLQQTRRALAGRGDDAVLADYDRAIALTEQALAGQIEEAAWRAALAGLAIDWPEESQPQERAGLTVAGNVHGDVVGGDKVGGDKVAGDKITHHTGIDQRGQTVQGDQYNAGRDVTVNQAPEPSPGPPNTRLWRWLVAAGIVVGLLAGVVAILSDSMNIWNAFLPDSPTVAPVPTKPSTMRGKFRIAVVGFSEGEQVKERGLLEAQRVVDALKTHFQSEISENQITVWGPQDDLRIKETEIIGGDKACEPAVRLGETIEADVVIFGIIGTDQTVSPKFCPTTQRFAGFYEIQEISDETFLGAPIPLSEHGDFFDRDRLEEEFGLSIELLSNLLFGLGNYYYTSEPNYDKALEYFMAADETAWPEEQGKYILYTWLANAAGKTGDFELATKYYRLSKELNPNYANAYLGLANLLYLEAQAKFEDTKNEVDIDKNLLDQAIATYTTAEKIALEHPSPDLPAKIDFALGEIFILYQLAEPQASPPYYDRAIEKFQAVILDYADGKSRPRLRLLAARSQARLGLLYKNTNPDCALKAYQTAIDLFGDTTLPEVNGYQTRVDDLLKQGARVDQCNI